MDAGGIAVRVRPTSLAGVVFFEVDARAGLHAGVVVPPRVAQDVISLVGRGERAFRLIDEGGASGGGVSCPFVR